MDMGKLKKELVDREHREIKSKNFGPEETQDRTRIEKDIAMAKKTTLKNELEAQMAENSQRQ